VLLRSLRVHARRGGERISLPRRSHTHALKHVLQDREVPPWRRERLPLLSDASGRIIAAGDIAFDAGFAAWLEMQGARLVWLSE
jgi:tRNA(Ile)-lysidine synthase